MSKNLTKAEIISAAAKDAGITKAAAEKVLNSALGTIQGGLVNGQRITLVGFGTFSKARRKARKGRNPQTGEAIKIKLTFRASRIRFFPSFRTNFFDFILTAGPTSKSPSPQYLADSI